MMSRLVSGTLVTGITAGAANQARHVACACFCSSVTMKLVAHFAASGFSPTHCTKAITVATSVPSATSAEPT